MRCFRTKELEPERADSREGAARSHGERGDVRSTKQVGFVSRHETSTVRVLEERRAQGAVELEKELAATKRRAPTGTARVASVAAGFVSVDDFHRELDERLEAALKAAHFIHISQQSGEVVVRFEDYQDLIRQMVSSRSASRTASLSTSRSSPDQPGGSTIKPSP